ncbi:MAG: aldo/keto reductase [Thermoanaerobaculia bacterium]|nr:aldo/keto reductase [Thermoanaerobaculia bacterium]
MATNRIDRREWMQMTLGAAAAALALPSRLLGGSKAAALIRRAIPSTGEKLPVVGLGSSATFSQAARGENSDALREVIKAMVDRGASVFDTAPSYGASEQVGGDIAAELGVASKIFWATKVNVAGRGGDIRADPAAARAQIESSFAKLKVSTIDLIQVHNLADVPTHLGVLKDLKKNGRVRYIGVTTTSKGQYATLQDVMKSEPIDFIGIDYAIDNRDVEESILPLAAARKIGVLVYLPFGRTRLFQRVAGKDLPDWARDFDATTWAQFFIKYVVSHPAVTVVTPATSKVGHMIDNIGGGIGRLPDKATRSRMAAFIDSLSTL